MAAVSLVLTSAKAFRRSAAEILSGEVLSELVMKTSSSSGWSLLEAEHGEEAVVYGGEMAEEVVYAVPAGSDFLLQLFVAQRCGELIETAKCGFHVLTAVPVKSSSFVILASWWFVLVRVCFGEGWGIDSVGVSLMYCRGNAAEYNEPSRTRGLCLIFHNLFD